MFYDIPGFDISDYSARIEGGRCFVQKRGNPKAQISMGEFVWVVMNTYTRRSWRKIFEVEAKATGRDYPVAIRIINP